MNGSCGRCTALTHTIGCIRNRQQTPQYYQTHVLNIKTHLEQICHYYFLFKTRKIDTTPRLRIFIALILYYHQLKPYYFQGFLLLSTGGYPCYYYYKQIVTTVG